MKTKTTIVDKSAIDFVSEHADELETGEIQISPNRFAVAADSQKGKQILSEIARGKGYLESAIIAPGTKKRYLLFSRQSA